MPHYISYDKQTGTITGYIESSNEHFNPIPRSDNEVYVEVTSPEHIDLVSKLSPLTDRLTAKFDGKKIRSLKVEPAFSGSIVLSCDKPDLDGDGVAELPADGTSVVRIRAQLLGNDKETIKVDGLRMDFRVTRGYLTQRHMNVQGSEAAVELRSAAETVRTEITATADGFTAGALTLEFIPGEEYKSLLAAAGKRKT